MENLQKTLTQHVKKAEKSKQTFIRNKSIDEKVHTVCSNIRIKAPIRFLLSCCVAKIDNPKIDIRKPYTEISGKDTFSGRSYDENIFKRLLNNLICLVIIQQLI